MQAGKHHALIYYSFALSFSCPVWLQYKSLHDILSCMKNLIGFSLPGDASVCASSGGVLLPVIYIQECKQNSGLQNFLKRKQL